MSVTAEPKVECILIADDLTGACDTGVQFVRRGLSCRVELNFSEHRPTAMSDILAFNTNSRNDEDVQSRQKIEEFGIACSQLKAKIIFKKVDSTLRGNVGEEIATALREFKCEAAIIAPAFPAIRRLVRGGILHWADSSGSGQIDIRRLLAEQGIPPEKLVSVSVTSQNRPTFLSDLEVQVSNGKQLFVFDCESQDDLRFVVRAGMTCRHRFLWVGSAGLGIAVADHLAKSQTHKSVCKRTDAPLIFVVGSHHLATLEQKKALLARTNAVEIAPTLEAIGDARRALRDNRHLVVTIEHGRHSEHSLHQFFGDLKGFTVAAMFLTGGDTGMSVCNAIGAQSIELCDEIMPGFPWGILSGGMFDDLPVASKSGGFGDQGALLRCAEFFDSRRKQ